MAKILPTSLLFIFIFYFFGYSQAPQLSANAEVSVLTFGPGTNLNDAFGHNAFRIKDPALGIDHVYGYGQYDFSAPNFYLKFASGKLNYLISKYNYSDIYNYYTLKNRSIKEQILNFTSEEKQRLHNILYTNYLPKNRAYLYDFFYDNCATRIRDVSQKASLNTITLNAPNNFENKTFRKLIHEHVGLNTWGSFGIDMALGSVIDKKATIDEYMFLPKYIHQFFGTATFGDDQPLVKIDNSIYNATEKNKSWLKVLWSPLFVFTLISVFIIYITYNDYKNQQRTKWLDSTIFITTGLAGIILTLLWFATDHSATAFNYNLLWAFPFNLLLIIPLIKTKSKKWVKGYIKFLLLALCLMLLHSITGVQVFSIVLIPFCLALGLRYLFLVKILN